CDFYPRPPRGGRLRYPQTGTARPYFYPRPPRGGRRGNAYNADNVTLFLPTPSARRATRCGQSGHQLHHNFYPRPPRGGRRAGPPSGCRRSPYFYPRPPRGGRHLLAVSCSALWGISTHALREEGDAMRPKWPPTTSQFLPTPSARRATGEMRTTPITSPYFYPRPPRAGRRAGRAHPPRYRAISTHAIREEGDHTPAGGPCRAGNFYPRPPRVGRRPTRWTRSGRANFYPRPPRGGRR